MKITISLPDALFRDADRLAKRLKKSRGELCRDALAEYLGRHAPEAVTDLLNALAQELDTRPDTFASTAAKDVLERSEW